MFPKVDVSDAFTSSRGFTMSCRYIVISHCGKGRSGHGGSGGGKVPSDCRCLKGLHTVMYCAPRSRYFSWCCSCSLLLLRFFSPYLFHYVPVKKFHAQCVASSVARETVSQPSDESKNVLCWSCTSPGVAPAACCRSTRRCYHGSSPSVMIRS